MKRTLNFRFLGLLVAAAAALAVAGNALHARQLKKNAGYLLGQADKAVAQKDFPAAARHLSHYLTFRPEDGRARAKYGALLGHQAKTGRDYEFAYLTLERALRDAPGLEQALRDDPALQEQKKSGDPELAKLADDETHIHRRAADLAVALGELANAKSHVEAALRDAPKDADLLVLLGRIEATAGKYDPAVKAFRAAIDARPSQVDAYLALAYLHRRLGQPADGDKVVTQLTQANPNDPKAQVGAARYHREANNLKAARENFDRAQAGSLKDDREVLLGAADLALAEKSEAEARAKLTRGLELYPDEPRFSLLLATLDFQAGKRAEAVALLRKAAEKLPKKSPDLWFVADLLVTAGESAEATALLARLREEKADPAGTAFLEARLRLADGKPLEAEKLLRDNQADLARKPDLAVRTELMLAECYERLGKNDLQLKAARQAASLAPTSLPARSALAAAQVRVGKPDEALTVYRGMFAEDPATRVTAARLLAGMGNPQAAVEALDGLPPDRAQSADVLLLRAAMLVGTQDKDKVATARKAVAEARDKFPQEPAFWVFLATTEADPKDGLAVLDRAQAAAGNGVRIRLARAALLARQKADPAAVRAVEAGADQLPAADRTALAFGLAEVYLRVGARPDAERLLREAADRQPGDLTVLFRLFEVSAATADPNRLEALRQAAEKAEGPDGAVWRVIDAYKSLRASQAGDPAGDLRHARTRLAEAGKLRPEWYWVPLLEADIESAQGRPDAAAELYARAVRLGARQPAVVERAVALLIDRRRGDEAQQLIADVRRRAPALTETLERYDVWGQAQRGASAEDLLERLKTTAPETSAKARDHLFRAGVLAAADRPKEAEAAYRKAAAVEPAAPEAWVGLVTFLARSNRADEARAEIAKAAKAVPADKLPLVLGPCYDAVGDRAEAEKQYAQAAAGSDPAALRALAWFYVVGGDAAKAEPVLRRLLADPNQKRWARRTLALVLAAGGFAQGTEALDLLEANLKEFPDSPEDLRARSLVQASRPEGRPQAIKDMEASFSRLPASPVEEFMLARLYELDDQWPNANKRMLDAVTRPGGDAPAFLAAYVAALLRHKDADAAGRWLDRLKEKAKGPSAVVVELQARLDAARDRKADAAAAVKAYVAAAAKEKPNPNLHRWAGTLLAEVGLKAEAEEYFREYVRAAEKADPNAPLVLADFLARHQNRVGDALALCVDALNRLDPELVARQTVAVLRLGDATAAHYAQAEGVIQKAARAKPRSADIPVSFADLRDAQGRYDDAKALYREILAAAPTNVLALNNLAWLLALHEGKTGEAVELLEQRAIKLVGRDGNLLDTLGVVRLTGNDTARAVADLTAACAQDARPERYFHLAQAHLKAGNKADALRAMKKAVQDLKLTKKDLHRLEWKAFDELLAMIGG